MPQTRIEIEEVGIGRWVAEVKCGRQSPPRRIRAYSFDDIVSDVIDAYRAVVPADAPIADRGAPQEVDPALFPPKPPPPIGKRGAQRMRRAADGL